MRRVELGSRLAVGYQTHSNEFGLGFNINYWPGDETEFAFQVGTITFYVRFT